MIARVWHNTTSASKGPDYLAWLRVSVLRNYISMSGNQKGRCMHRTVENKAQFYMVTLWDDIHAATLGTARLSMEEGGQIRIYCVCAASSPNT